MKKTVVLKTLGISCFLLILLFPSCTHDSMGDIPEPSGCDTTEVSFSATIAPIIEQYCYNGCHNGDSPSSGIPLDSYEGVKAKVDENRLRGAIAQEVGFVAMPLGSDPLPDCEREQIRAWVAEGATNN